jgi:hypothetical protein
LAYVLVAELPDAQSPASALSLLHRGVVLDFFVLAPGADGFAAARAICDVSGGTQAERQSLFDTLLRADPNARRMESRGDHLRANIWFSMDRMAPSSRLLARFCSANHLPVVWGRVEEGTTTFRFYVAHAEDVERLSQRLEAYLQQAGLAAQVAQEAVTDDAVARRIRDAEDLLLRLGSRSPERF